jgi:hypothetical protein
MNLGGGMSGGGKSQNGHEQRTNTQQEASPRQENAIETTVAPEEKAHLKWAKLPP